MTEFAHKFSTKYAHTHAIIDDEAKFTLILRKSDHILLIDSNDCKAYEDEDMAISAAMFAVKDHEDECDVYHLGEYFGTAEYVDLNPDSFFSTEQVVFSQPY